MYSLRHTASGWDILCDGYAPHGGNGSTPPTEWYDHRIVNPVVAAAGSSG